jgi:hypothetical protein
MWSLKMMISASGGGLTLIAQPYLLYAVVKNYAHDATSVPLW